MKFAPSIEPKDPPSSDTLDLNRRFKKFNERPDIERWLTVHWWSYEGKQRLYESMWHSIITQFPEGDELRHATMLEF